MFTKIAIEKGNVPIRMKDIRVGDRYNDLTYGMLTVTKVYPFDPKYPRSQQFDTDRGRRDMDPERIMYVERADG